MNEFCIHETCIFAVVYCKVRYVVNLLLNLRTTTLVFILCGTFVAQVCRFMTPGCMRCCVQYWRQLMM